MHRMYENEDIVVIWDLEKCFHAMQCVHGSLQYLQTWQQTMDQIK